MERLRLQEFPEEGKRSPERQTDLEIKANEETGTQGSMLALPFFTFLVQLSALHPSSRPFTTTIIYGLDKGPHLVPNMALPPFGACD